MHLLNNKLCIKFKYTAVKLTLYVDCLVWNNVSVTKYSKWFGFWCFLASVCSCFSIVLCVTLFHFQYKYSLRRFDIFHGVHFTAHLDHVVHLHIQIMDNIKYTGSPIMYYVSLLSIAGNFLTHLMANLEAFFTRSDEEKIYRRLREINEIFAIKLNYTIDYNAIRRKFVRQTVVYFAFSAALSLALSFFSLPRNGSVAQFLLTRIMSVLMIRARRCQIAFHINALTNILWDLQVLLKRQQESYRASTMSSGENIQHLRDVYSNAWLMKNLISKCFGWSLITLLIEFTTELINFCYWAYINITVYRSTVRIIRKISINMKLDWMK